MGTVDLTQDVDFIGCEFREPGCNFELLYWDDFDGVLALFLDVISQKHISILSEA